MLRWISQVSRRDIVNGWLMIVFFGFLDDVCRCCSYRVFSEKNFRMRPVNLWSLRMGLWSNLKSINEFPYFSLCSAHCAFVRNECCGKLSKREVTRLDELISWYRPFDGYANVCSPTATTSRALRVVHIFSLAAGNERPYHSQFFQLYANWSMYNSNDFRPLL